MILADCSLGIEKNELGRLYKDAVKQPFHFLKIDLETRDGNKKFSKTLQIFIILKTNAKVIATRRDGKNWKSKKSNRIIMLDSSQIMLF